jgi:hypothetical protein
MFEVLPESLHSVQIIFTERESAGGSGGPGIDQGHLHDIETLRRGAQIGAAIGDVEVNIGPLVEMFGISGVTAAHDGVGNDGIYFDAGDAGAAAGQGTQHVNASARTDNGKISAGPENVGQRRRAGHENAFPRRTPHVFWFDIHDVSGGIGIDHDCFVMTPAVHFHTGQGVPAGKFHPSGIAEDSLGIDHIDEPVGKVSGNEHQECGEYSASYSAFLARDGPNGGRHRQGDAREQDGIRPTHPV